MAEGVTISVTCKKVFNSHKPIKESKKSKESMTLQIAKIESHNLAQKNMTLATKKTKIMVLQTSKLKYQSLLHKLKAAKLE